MMVDEADMDITSASSTKGIKRSNSPMESNFGQSNISSPRFKRKPGPIPKDVVVRRPVKPTYSPDCTPPNSPVPWSYSELNCPASPPTPPPPVSSPSLITPVIPQNSTIKNWNNNNGNNVTSLSSTNPISSTYSNNSSNVITNLTVPTIVNNCSVITEQKLVNGDLSYAASLGVFECSGGSDGACNTTVVNHNLIKNNDGKLTNHVDYIIKSNINANELTNSVVCKTELQSTKSDTKPLNTNVDGYLDNKIISAGRLKCFTELNSSTCGTSYSSSYSTSNTNSGNVAGIGVSTQPIANHIEERIINKLGVKEVERQLTIKELEDIRKHNLIVRTEIYKLIRRKGNSEYLFIYL